MAMHVLYNPETLLVECVMYDCHESTAAFNRTKPNHFECGERIPHDELRIVRDCETGKPVLHRLRDGAAGPVETLALMPIVAPQRLTLGVEAAFAGVPAGAAIEINGVAQGAMDASGRLEFTARTAAVYRFKFSGRGWVTWETAFEAVAG